MFFLPFNDFHGDESLVGLDGIADAADGIGKGKP